METTPSFIPFRKKSSYFQEITVILNSFKPKRFNKHISSRNPDQLQLIPHERNRLTNITLPKISLSPSHDATCHPPSNNQGIHFCVQGNRQTIKGKIWNFNIVPSGHRITKKKAMKESSMSTDNHDDVEISEHYRLHEGNSL